MPPIPNFDFTNLTNAELANKIREYGVEVGPIVASTRGVYERKYERLLSGGSSAPSSPSMYEPVDDESDEEEIMETVQTRSTQNPARPTRSPVRQTYSEPRRRTEVREAYVPRGEGAGEPISTPPRPLPRRPLHTATSTPKKGMPLWVKLSLVFALVIFGYLIVKNMESNAQSNIPQELEVEL